MRDEREGAVPPRVLCSSGPTVFFRRVRRSSWQPSQDTSFFRSAAAALRSFREPLRQNDARPPLHLPRPARPGDGGVGAQRQSRGRTRSLSEPTCSEPVSESETV